MTRNKPDESDIHSQLINDNNNNNSESDGRTRGLIMEVEGVKHEYDQLSKEEFARLMDILKPVMAHISEKSTLSYH